MKNLNLKIMALLALMFTVQFANAQEIRAGLHTGFPVGDAADISSFNLGIDGSVYFYSPTETLKLGVSTGYTRFFGEDEVVEIDDFAYIPIAASGRGAFGSNLFYTADIGYGIGLDDADGGLYYQGKFGWTNGKLDIFAFYRGISESDIDISSIGGGFAFKIF